MVAGIKVMLFLGLAALTAAQQCQDYWKGKAPICKPDDSCDATHHYFGVRNDRGDGAPCWTGKKKLCECIVSGGNPACQPTLPPKTLTILNGWVTICNNGCKTYICGVKFIRFWKKRDEMSLGERTLQGVHRRRLLPCEDAPEQIHCQDPDPEPPASPPNEISSRPLTPNEVLNAFRQTETSGLVELVGSLGESTAGKTKDQLVEVAYNRFTSAMKTLRIGKINAEASFARFQEGPSALTYIDGSGPPPAT
ncbi:MAG: hypothetical protein Q9171_002271 [Xanthocarpia ochracea]